MAYANGQIPLTALTPLSVGGHLLAPAAAAFETWRNQARAAGYNLTITSVGDAYRNYQRQMNVFRERYEMRPFPNVGPYGDVRMRGAAAAVPGTSNHGKGVAVDISNVGGFGSRFYSWLSATGPKLGFTNTEGRIVNEAWHWVHNGTWTVNNPIGGGGGIITNPNIPNVPNPLEDELSAKAEAEISRILQIAENLDVSINNAATGQVRKAADRILGVLPATTKGLTDAVAGGVWGAEVGSGENRRAMSRVLLDTPLETWRVKVRRGDEEIGALQEVADAKTLALKAQAQLEIVLEALNTVATSKGLAPEDLLAAVKQGAHEGAAQAVKDGIIVDVNVSGPKESAS